MELKFKNFKPTLAFFQTENLPNINRVKDDRAQPF